MSLESEQFTYITSDGTFSGLAGARLYPVFIPQDADLPAASYQVIGGAGKLRGHDGVQNVRGTRIQYTCTAETYGGAKSLAAAIRARLEGYPLTMGAVSVFETEVTEDIDGYNQPNNLQTVRLDCIFWVA